MAERNWTVGSLPDCDIRVENAAVSGRHCRLTQRGESLLLEDLGSTNGTFVAGEQITGPRIVRRGDPVTLGRNTPLPWPPKVNTVTIGRLPDNDIVIPLDMISGHHARLEQDGNTVYLVDEGSSNGTAINDLPNKITRATIQPTDQVFFGTHRVAAWELLKALPKKNAVQATALESAALPDLERELSSPGIGGERRLTLGRGPEKPFRLQSNWAWGMGLSILCAILMLGVPRLFAPGTRDQSETARTHQSDNELTIADAVDSRASTASNSADMLLRGGPHRPQVNLHRPEKPGGKSATKPNAAASETSRDQTSFDSTLSPTAEAAAHRSDEALALVGIRIDSGLVVSSVTAWACREDAVICPTATLESLESKLVKGKGRDESLVVCTPRKTLAILEHTAGVGPALGFSLAKLEGRLDTACSTSISDTPLLPDQPLAMLTCSCAKHDQPETMLRSFRSLKISRIERSADKQPLLLHCSGGGISGDVQGSPVFDSAGAVVGCAGPSAGGVDVIPVARLSDLIGKH